MSIHEEPQIEQNISSGSVPTTIRSFDGTDPVYTVEEYLNSIVAAIIFSSGIEPVNKPRHHQWKVKRTALILHTLQGPAQKWYSTLPSETKLDWETFCKEFSDMFDSEKSKQQAKMVLQQLQKHTIESLRSLALRIETLVKTAYSLYKEDYRNSVMNQTFIRCLDNKLKTAALKKHANHKQTPRESEMPFKTLVDKIDQMDLTRTVTNNHKRIYEVNQITTNISEHIKQMNIACNNINDLNQNDLEQFEGTICNILNGINNTYDRKNFKGRPKFALFCSYCSSHGHRKCFKRPQGEIIARSKERSFYSHMRNIQNLPNRRIDSNNINGRQLPSTSPVYHNSRSRTPYRSQSRNHSNINSYSRDNRNYQGHRNSNNNYNNRNGSHNRNNYNRSRTNSYNRNNNLNKYNNSRSRSRYTNRSHSRQLSSYNRNNSNNNYNNNNRQRHYSKDSNKSDRCRQRSGSNNRHYSNNKKNRDERRNSTQREQNDRYHSKDRRTNGNKYNNNNKNRINNIETERQNDDPPGIDDYKYTSESSNEDQEILDKFYNANEDTCNTVKNTLESNTTWILPMYQCNKIEQNFTKQRPILVIDFLLDSGATLNLLNEDAWNEIKYNNPQYTP